MARVKLRFFTTSLVVIFASLQSLGFGQSAQNKSLYFALTTKYAARSPMFLVSAEPTGVASAPDLERPVPSVELNTVGVLLGDNSATLDTISPLVDELADTPELVTMLAAQTAPQQVLDDETNPPPWLAGWKSEGLPYPVSRDIDQAPTYLSLPNTSVSRKAGTTNVDQTAAEKIAAVEAVYDSIRQSSARVTPYPIYIIRSY